MSPPTTQHQSSGGIRKLQERKSCKKKKEDKVRQKREKEKIGMSDEESTK